MKKTLSIALAVLLLLSCLIAGIPAAYASQGADDTRAIAIVFDNSGSMYTNGEKAWCRATYAMEVFASMLNEGDTLMIYPMHPIIIEGKEYTMDSPFVLRGSTDASKIRDIYTDNASGTPIETIGKAVDGLKKSTAGQKTLIVLTDGDTFSQGKASLSPAKTKAALNAEFEGLKDAQMDVMYLGIGKKACIPGSEVLDNSAYFVKKHAQDSATVLSSLTSMCNRIFGRDVMKDDRVTNSSVEFDISMTKLIVFVQGQSISDLTVTSADGQPVGKLVSTKETKYSTKGCGSYTSVPDETLQGMMVTYTDCDAGKYNINYKGTASEVEVYYEPNADLEFVFTDIDGNDVDPNALYEGQYKVSFGMKDAKTGKLIESDLLGNPKYNGTYSINGKKVPIKHEGYSGSVEVALKKDDTFDATLTVTYLNGYSITKDSTDFGWEKGGIKVAPRPAGELVLEITGGEDYVLQDLEKGKPYTVKVFYQGTQLTGDALKNVSLKWDPDTSNAEITKEFADDHYKLHIGYKDPKAPEKTACGDCTVFIYGSYTAQGSEEAKAQAPLAYNIIDDFSPIIVDLETPQSYFVISDLEESKALVAKVKFKDRKMTAEEFENVDIKADCGGIKYKITPNKDGSAYLIKLLPTKDIQKGDYPIKVTATYKDRLDRETTDEDSAEVTLSNIPLWVKWLGISLILLLIIALILIILHIKVLPKKAHVTRRDSTMIFDGEDESRSTTFLAKMEKGTMSLSSKYAGTKTGLNMDVKPGKESYLRKPATRKSAEVKSASVRKFGTATIQEATIGSIKYVLNEETNKLERVPKTDAPFELRHGTRISYSGTMLSGGIPKSFTVTTKLNFNKQK